MDNSAVSISASFCVWTKSLMCKDVVNRDSTIQSDVRRFCLQLRRMNFKFPVNRLDDRAIPSERPSVHCSILPDDMSSRPDARQTKHHPFGRRVSLSGPSTVSRRFYPACIHPDISAARPDASQY
jgi:hypothetical protein